MTNYSFYDTIPATNHNPATDQPGMLINNACTKGIIGTDHVTFGLANGGSHTSLNFWSNTTPALGVGEKAVLYPGLRPSTYTSASAEISTNLYVLNNATVAGMSFPTSMIKAGGTFVTTSVNAAVSPESQFNLGVITRSGTGLYTINLLAGATTGNDVIVLPTFKATGTPVGFSLPPDWNFANNILELGCGSSAGITVTFIILQI